MYRVKGADQKEYGPVSADQILRWIQENRLNRQSLVQKEGDPAWKSLDQYPEFAAALAAPAPAVGATPGTTPVTGPSVSAPLYSAVADPQRAASAVKAPAIFLLIIGIVGILFSVVALMARPWMMDSIIQIVQEAGGPPEALDQLRAERDRGIGAQDIFSLVLGLVANAVIIMGALAMQRLEKWGLAMAAAILCMLPCTFCCCLTLPVGIWAVVVLNRAYVKSAFR